MGSVVRGYCLDALVDKDNPQEVALWRSFLTEVERLIGLPQYAPLLIELVSTNPNGKQHTVGGPLGPPGSPFNR